MSESESPCQAAKRLNPAKRDPSDVIVRRPRITSRCEASRDAGECMADYESVWYPLEGDYYAMPRPDHTRLKQRWWTVQERAQAAGIQIAGPGTLLERWIKVATAVGTLGLISLNCSGCASRKAKLDRLGWQGLTRLVLAPPAPGHGWRWSQWG